MGINNQTMRLNSQTIGINSQTIGINSQTMKMTIQTEGQNIKSGPNNEVDPKTSFLKFQNKKSSYKFNLNFYFLKSKKLHF